MRSRLCFLGYYFLFWLLYFSAFRVIFMLYHYDQTSRLSWDIIGGTFIHGFRMDLSFTAYLCSLVFMVMVVSTFLKGPVVASVLRWFTLVVLAFITFLCVADLELFKEWGFRLDSTPLTYISTPREMAISASSSPFTLLITSIILVTLFSYFMYRKKIQLWLENLPAVHPANSLLFLFLTASLIIPVRGGFQLASLNQSTAFFSKNDFANQAALNVPWNFFRSLTMDAYSLNNPYRSLSPEHAHALVDAFYHHQDSANLQVLNHSQPNVVLILWESFSAKALPALGGNHEGVVPQFESLIPEGILFKNFYANGERSDKGLVSVLSGYPAQPKKSIIKIPNKSYRLPVLTHQFQEKGYHTAFYYGGELEFANIKSYLVHADFDLIVGKSSFKKEDMNSKWGTHDHVVFQRALDDLNNRSDPFFSMIFTLSSHEPFEIPVAGKFPGDDLEELYLSSLNYTDQSLGNFIKEAKKQAWYDHTLIIILADHGHRLLDANPRFDPGKYHIPMLWLGGALAVRDTVISKYGSQTDLPRTLLKQVGMDAEAFTWSRDLLASGSGTGAFYVFNEGISYVNSGEQVIYDHQRDNFILSGQSSPENRELCKAHLQVAYEDYLNK